MEQLDDALIFFLATLPCNSFKVARSIFQMYSNGKVKGQKVPKSKKNVQAKPLDLKGSNFRCLRGVAEDAVHSLLVDVKNRKLSLQELSSQCQSMKQLSRIQAGFMKATNCSSWDEAEEKYPKFVSPEQLEPFKKLSFTGSTLPEPFMKFCQTAMKSTSALPTATAVREDAHDDVFVIPHGSELGIFWKMDVFAVNGDHLDKVLKKVRFRTHYACCGQGVYVQIYTMLLYFEEHSLYAVVEATCQRVNMHCLVDYGKDLVQWMVLVEPNAALLEKV